MKNKNLNMLIKASVSSKKLSVVFFSLFTMLSTVLILISVGIILPLRSNIENNLNNHILNRELIAEFNEKTSDDDIDEMMSEVDKIEYVTDIYRTPASLTVFEESGILHSDYTLGYIHSGFTPTITSGRCFNENETGVAIVPELMNDYNEDEHRINEISGEQLIGKTLIIKDECDNTYEFEIVVAYNTTDPIFSGDEIIIPQAELLKCNNKVLTTGEGLVSISADKSYTILIDSVDDMENAMQEVSDICVVYQRTTAIDAESYNIALIILLIALAVFIILVIVGFYILVKNNLSNRTNELALYRSLGYKTSHILYIVFAEHLFFGVLSMLIGLAVTVLMNVLFVNPYLYTLVGNTIMEMTVSITFVQVACIFVFFIAILFFASRSAAKRSEKIDLTVLLREK